MQAVSVKYADFCALTASRLVAPPLQHPPAVPLGPGQRLRVGYVSSDFGNHPLSHLMASVFGLHDRSRLEVLRRKFWLKYNLSSRQELLVLLHLVASVVNLHDRSRCAAHRMFGPALRG